MVRRRADWAGHNFMRGEIIVTAVDEADEDAAGEDGTEDDDS